jgi:hypothetical protein
MAETGKQRAAKIPLDYFRHPSWLDRWRLWLAGIALALAVIWVVAGVLQGQAGQVRYSHGPLATAHALWEDQCQACHIPLVPIREQQWTKALAGSSQDGSARCRNCHEGPPHHAAALPAISGCADCHHEHAGRDASLVRLADSECTQCHIDLPAHTAGGNTRYQSVARFSKSAHPEFQILREHLPDPGTLKFNHKLHLSAGMATVEKGDPNWTLARIPRADRERYRRPGQHDNDRVQLDCTSCHQLDARDLGRPEEQLTFPASAWPAGKPGAYMVPITYENQCQACHPLAIDAGSADRPPIAAPHRLQPADLHAWLRLALVERYLEHSDVLDEFVGTSGPQLPGQRRSEKQRRAAELLDRQVYEAEKLLYRDRQSCGECHEFRSSKAQPIAAALAPGALPQVQVMPTRVPSVWFSHASFSHLPHRALECLACHADAYADSPRASTTSRDVLLPGIDNCLQCHRAAGSRIASARFDCTECHRYHHRDQTAFLPQGATRGAKEHFNVDAFLEGARLDQDAGSGAKP